MKEKRIDYSKDAQKMLENQGYYSKSEGYEFGDSDSHSSRALYLVATGGQYWSLMKIY